jgi:hypothetical protein
VDWRSGVPSNSASMHRNANILTHTAEADGCHGRRGAMGSPNFQSLSSQVASNNGCNVVPADTPCFHAVRRALIKHIVKSLSR